ncbi:acyltransferase [Bdellovibrionota bacterium FG-2]
MKSKYAVIGARILLGLIFTVFGLNGFLGFLPMPPMPGPAGAFAGALAASGYFFPFMKSIEVITGVMILTGFQLPFALILLAPIAINIFLFHLLLVGPATIAMPVVILALMVFLAYSYRDHYASIFKK